MTIGILKTNMMFTEGFVYHLLAAKKIASR